VHFLRSAPELQARITSGGAAAGGAANPRGRVVSELSRVLTTLDGARGPPVTPLAFVHAFRTAFPQFAQASPAGVFAQQDAQECVAQLLQCVRGEISFEWEGGVCLLVCLFVCLFVFPTCRTMHSRCPITNANAYTPHTHTHTYTHTHTHTLGRTPAGAVEPLLEGRLTSTLACPSRPDLPATTRTDPFTHLTCHISAQTNHLHDGLEQALTEKISKRVPEPGASVGTDAGASVGTDAGASVGTDAEHVKTTRISALPPYLTIHFVRFFWKAREAVKAKILRRVQYPLVLDVFNLCAEGLKTELGGTRERVREIVDRAVAAQTAGIDAANTTAGIDAASTTAASTTAADAMTDDTDTAATPAATPAATAAATTSAPTATATAEEDAALLASLEDVPTGLYELCAVLTHQGREADGGHYVAWAKGTDGESFSVLGI
jgi:ubiquitin carboxyl-terminal hydrolase 14